jgi:hypothetical protein
MSVEDYHSALLHRLRDRLQLKTFEGKGRGLAAAKAIAIGEVLMVEEPLLSHQFAGNASIVDSCHQCQRFVGTLQQQLNKLATVQIPEHFSAGADSEAVFEKQEALDTEYPSLPDRLNLPCLDAESAVISKVVMCPYGCGAQFCSDSCLDKALRQHHILLCTHFKSADAAATHAGASEEEAADSDAINAALLFRQQALQTSEMFLFAAKLLGRVLEAWSRNGNNLEAALAPFLALHSAPLWKVRGLRELADAQIDAMLRQQAAEEGREDADDASAKGVAAGAGAGAGAPGDDGEEGTGVIPLKFLLARVNAEEAALAKAGCEGMFDGLRAQVGEQLLDSLTILRALVTERLPGIVAYIRDGRVPASGADGEAAHTHHGKPAAAGAGAECGHNHGSGARGHDHGHHGHHHHHEDGAACMDASHSHAAAPASSVAPSSGVEAAAAPASDSTAAVGLSAFRDWEADMLFDPALYERLVAACELNAIEVKIDSPLRDYLSIVRSLPRKAAKGAPGGKAGKGKSGGGGVSPYESAMIELVPLLEQMRGARQARKRVRREMEALKHGGEEEEEEGEGEEEEEAGAAGKAGKQLSGKDEEEEEDEDEEEEDDGDFDSDFDTDEEEDGEEDEEEEDDGFGLSAREVRRLCPLSKGSALFAVISCLNHSCEPNVQVAYAEGDRRAALIPMRKLAEGEEVCINYCDVEQELDQRRVDILQYGFVCGCSRCKADEAKLAASSSA